MAVHLSFSSGKGAACSQLFFFSAQFPYHLAPVCERSKEREEELGKV